MQAFKCKKTCGDCVLSCRSGAIPPVRCPFRKANVAEWEQIAGPPTDSPGCWK